DEAPVTMNTRPSMRMLSLPSADRTRERVRAGEGGNPPIGVFALMSLHRDSDGGKTEGGWQCRVAWRLQRLVPRPRHSALPFVAKASACLGSSEPPHDFAPTAVTARGPRARAITEGIERVDAIATMTLAGPETGF